jgi:hypothetical protein
MKSSLVVIDRLTANAPVAPILGSIPPSVGTVESEGAADEANKNPKNIFFKPSCLQVSDSLAAPPPVSLAEVAEAVRLSVLQENLLHRMEQLVLTSGLPISGSLQQLAEQHSLIQGWKAYLLRNKFAN